MSDRCVYFIISLILQASTVYGGIQKSSCSHYFDVLFGEEIAKAQDQREIFDEKRQKIRDRLLFFISMQNEKLPDKFKSRRFSSENDPLSADPAVPIKGVQSIGLIKYVDNLVPALVQVVERDSDLLEVRVLPVRPPVEFAAVRTTAYFRRVFSFDEFLRRWGPNPLSAIVNTLIEGNMIGEPVEIDWMTMQRALEQFDYYKIYP